MINRRVIAAVAAGLLLASCVPEADTVSTAPESAAPASHAMSVAPDSSEAPEPVSWTGIYSADTPVNTAAQVHVYNETDDSFEFSVIYFEFETQDDSDDVDVRHDGFRGTAYKLDGGTAAFEVESNYSPVHLNIMNDADYIQGTLTIYDNRLSLDIEKAEYNQYETVFLDVPAEYVWYEDAEAERTKLPFSGLEDG